MELRPAEETDLAAIHAIYNLEVTQSTVTFDLVARSPVEQRAWLDEHRGAYPAIVATDAGEIVGFASLSPFRARPAYATTAEDSVYVHRDHRGRGIGRILLTEIVALARSGGFHSVIAHIVGGHETSIALHRSLGFSSVGTEKEVGRKFGRWLDVHVMQLLINSEQTP